MRMETSIKSVRGTESGVKFKGGRTDDLLVRLSELISDCIFIQVRR